MAQMNTDVSGGMVGMKNDAPVMLKAQFDDLSQTLPDENIEFWFARDLMQPLGYMRWENFISAINRAITSCQSTGFMAEDHFRGVTKMIEIGKGGQRAWEEGD